MITLLNQLRAAPVNGFCLFHTTRMIRLGMRPTAAAARVMAHAITSTYALAENWDAATQALVTGNSIINQLELHPETFNTRAALTAYVASHVKLVLAQGGSADAVLGAIAIARSKLVAESMKDMLIAFDQMGRRGDGTTIKRELFALASSSPSVSQTELTTVPAEFGVAVTPAEFIKLLLEDDRNGKSQLQPPYAFVCRRILASDGALLARWHSMHEQRLAPEIFDFLKFFDNQRKNGAILDRETVQKMSIAVMLTLAKHGIGLISPSSTKPEVHTAVTRANQIEHVPVLLKLAVHPSNRESWHHLQISIASNAYVQPVGSYVLRWLRHIGAHNTDFIVLSELDKIGFTAQCVHECHISALAAIWAGNRYEPDAQGLPVLIKRRPKPPTGTRPVPVHVL